MKKTYDAAAVRRWGEGISHSPKAEKELMQLVLKYFTDNLVFAIRLQNAYTADSTHAKLWVKTETTYYGAAARPQRKEQDSLAKFTKHAASRARTYSYNPFAIG